MAIPTARLPRSLVPLPGESLPGFLLRLGHRLDMSPGLTAWRCGIAGAHPNANQAAGSYLFLLDAGKRERFAQTTGACADAAGRLTLHSLIDRFPPVAQSLISPKDPGRTPRSRLVFPPWVLASRSRYCPACLAGDGSAIQQRHGGPWLLRWRLATSFACTKHNRLLEDHCPDCDVPVGFESGGGEFDSVRLFASPGLAGLHPACCRSRRRDRWPNPCGHRLDDTDTLPGTALTPELAHLQEHLDRLLTSRVEPTRAFEAFADLQVITAIVLASWPSSAAAMPASHAAAVDEHIARQEKRLAGSGSHQIRWDRGLAWSFLPKSPLGTAAVLSAAHNLLRLPAAELRAELGRVTGQIPGRDHKRWGRIWQIFQDDASPEVRAHITQAVPELFPLSHRRTLPANAWTRYRVIPSLLPVQLDRHHGYRPEQIPQELPDHWVRIFHNDPTLTVTPALRRLRRTLAIRLVQAVSGMDAQQAADYLGVPPGTNLLNTDSPQVPRRAPAESSAELRKGIDRLAEHLASLPPGAHPDYHFRRQHFATWHLTNETFEELHGLVKATDKRRFATSPARLHDALSAIVWRRVTGSEYCLAPCFRPPFSPTERRADSMTIEVNLARRLEQAPPRSPYRRLLPALEELVHDLVTSCDTMIHHRQ
ncbi:TniQ family protein [Kitasatospora xanthocidica]|uniref:TniQ family protein n=1 Tax=Kitasatospora xanthocidica TaxID=83382 RepID=UPI0036EC1628